MVLLDKLRLQTRAKEEEENLKRGGKDPFIVVKNPSASKGGVAETSIKVRHNPWFHPILPSAPDPHLSGV